MCGIAFVINYGKGEIDREFMASLFTNMDDRGGDASGYYFERPKKGKMIRRLCKAPITGSDLWDEIHIEEDSETPKEKEFNSKYEMDGSEKLVMLHTRKRTQGVESENHNNMPIYSKDWILAHNGMVSANRLERFPYKGEVDSEEIIARLQVYNGDWDRALSEVYGSMAIIAKKIKDNELFIWRNSNPLDLVFHPEARILVGVSCAEYAMDFRQRDNMNLFFKERGISSCQTAPNILYKVSLLEESVETIAKIHSPIRVTTPSVHAITSYGRRSCED